MSVQWRDDTEEHNPAIKVLNDALRASMSAKRFGLVDDDLQRSHASMRFVSAVPIDKGSPVRMSGSYQGSAMASITDMLAADDFGNGATEQHTGSGAPGRPPRSGRRGGSDATAAKALTFGAADSPSGASGQSQSSTFGPPDPSIYSPSSPAPASGLPPQRTSNSGFCASQAAVAQDKPASLSAMLDRFAAEDESGPIIRNRNYARQLPDANGRSPSVPRGGGSGTLAAPVSLAELDQSYQTGRGSRAGSRSNSVIRGSRGGEQADEEAVDGEDGEGYAMEGTGRQRPGSLPNPFEAATDAARALVPTAPPCGGGLPSSRQGSRQASPARGLSRVSSMSDMHDPPAGKPIVVFHSVSALPPIAQAGSHSPLPPPPRPPRASPQPPAAPMPGGSSGEVGGMPARTLSRGTSPARGSVLGAGGAPVCLSRDASPSRPVPRMMGSRDASPGGAPLRPMAPTEIVAAAVAQIAASQRTSAAGMPPHAPPRPPPRPDTGAYGALSGGAPPPPDPALMRDPSPVRRGGAPSGVRVSRDSMPLSSLAQQQRGHQNDDEPDAEMMTVAWRLPMRMGATQSSSKALDRAPPVVGRTSRDSSPTHARGMRGLTDEPSYGTPPRGRAGSEAGGSASPAPGADGQQQQPARPPKPLTKPPNWGRGGAGPAPSQSSSDRSGLGATLPHLEKAHVFIHQESGEFGLVRERDSCH